MQKVYTRGEGRGAVLCQNAKGLNCLVLSRLVCSLPQPSTVLYIDKHFPLSFPSFPFIHHTSSSFVSSLSFNTLFTPGLGSVRIHTCRTKHFRIPSILPDTTDHIIKTHPQCFAKPSPPQCSYRPSRPFKHKPLPSAILPRPVRFSLQTMILCGANIQQHVRMMPP